MKVKVLSVRQPWAYLIIAGFKDVENRNWKTEYRGPLYIHAGKTFDWNALLWLYDNGFTGESFMVIRHFGLILHETIPEKSKITRHQEEFGALLGKVNLVDCIPNDVPCASDRAIVSGWAQVGCHHWKLANAEAITPMPMRGRLGIWEHEL